MSESWHIAFPRFHSRRWIARCISVGTSIGVDGSFLAGVVKSSALVDPAFVAVVPAALFGVVARPLFPARFVRGVVDAVKGFFSDVDNPYVSACDSLMRPLLYLREVASHGRRYSW